MQPIILIMIAVIVISITVAFVIFPEVEGDEYEFNFPTLGFTNSPNMICKLKSESHSIGNQGKLRTSATPFFTTTPFLQYEITGKNDPGDIKDQFLIELEIKCDDTFTSGFGKNVILGRPTLLPTDVNLFVEAIDVDGEKIEFKKVTSKIKQVQLKDSFTPEIIASFLINADSIEREFSESVSPYNSQISFEITGTLKFKFADVGGNNEWEIALGRTATQTGAFVTINKIKAPEPNPTFRSSPIIIEQIEQVCKRDSVGSCTVVKLDGTTKKLDTSKSQERQIRVLGVVRDWTPEQGAPKITINHGSSILVNNIGMSFDKFVDSDKDDAQFKFLYTVPRNTPDGKIFAKMTLEGRDNPSTRFFYVEDQSVENVPKPIDFKDDTTTVRTIPTSLDIKWELFYLSESGEKVDRGVIEGTGSVLDSLAFITNFGGNNQNAKLQTTRLTAYNTFESEVNTGKFSSTDSSLIFDVGVIVDGERKKLGEFSQTGFVKSGSSCIRDFEGTKQCSNFGFPLGLIDIQTRDLDNLLSRAGIATGTDVIINIIIGGAYEMKDENGDLYIGSAEGAEFNYPIKYVISGTDGGFSEDLECPPGTTLKALSGGGFICSDIAGDGENACNTDEGFVESCLPPEDRTEFKDKNNNGLKDPGEVGCFDIFGTEIECNPDTPTEEGDFKCFWMNTDDGLVHVCSAEEEESARSNAPTNCQFGFDALQFCKEDLQTGSDNEVTDNGEPSGTPGNAGICNGTILQCADALDDLLDSQKNEEDSTLFVAVAIIVIIIIALIVYIKRGG